jgi:class 3 adenylate cyclase
VRARRVENTAVLFSDVVGFTSWCDGRQPEEVVQTLHGMFLRLEHVARTFGVEKLKTVGDGFMGAAGLLESSEDPLLAAVRCALAMAAEVSAILPGWQLRAGIHVGPVVAGIVGGERYQFDIWGDTVNVAARLAAAAAPGKVAVLAETWLRIPAGVKGASLGMQRLKGKGEREVFEITHLL